MSKKAYTAQVPIQHDGADVPIGATVHLEDGKQADQLVTVGAVSLDHSKAVDATGGGSAVVITEDGQAAIKAARASGYTGLLAADVAKSTTDKAPHGEVNQARNPNTVHPVAALPLTAQSPATDVASPVGTKVTSTKADASRVTASKTSARQPVKADSAKAAPASKATTATRTPPGMKSTKAAPTTSVTKASAPKGMKAAPAVTKSSHK